MSIDCFPDALEMEGGLSGRCMFLMTLLVAAGTAAANDFPLVDAAKNQDHKTDRDCAFEEMQRISTSAEFS